jgi:hypothetical protein
VASVVASAIAGVILSAVPDPRRILLIERENRSFSIDEDRNFLIEPENRTVEVS